MLLWGMKRLYSSVIKVHGRCCDDGDKNVQFGFFSVIKSGGYSGMINAVMVRIMGGWNLLF